MWPREAPSGAERGMGRKTGSPELADIIAAHIPCGQPMAERPGSVAFSRGGHVPWETWVGVGIQAPKGEGDL